MKRSYSVYEPAKRARSLSFSQPSAMSDYSASTSSVQASSARLKRGYAPMKKYKKKSDQKVAKIAQTICKRVLAKDDELKYVIQGSSGGLVGQTNTAIGPVTTSGHFAAQITLPAVGTAQNQRVGDKIKLKSLKLSFNFKGLAKTNNTKLLKFLLVKTKGPIPDFNIDRIFQPNAGIDVSNGGTGDGTVAKIYDYATVNFRNPDYIDSYNVLYERDFVVKACESDSGAASAGGDRSMYDTFNLDIPLRGMTYEAVGTTVINQQIGWYLLCDSGEKNAINPTITGIYENTENTGLSFTHMTRLEYTDA